MAGQGIASMLGRPDLSSSFNVMTITPNGNYTQGGRMAPPIGAGVGPSASYGASVQGDVSLGQTSLGLLAGMVVALALFYIWTRGRQV